MVKKLVDIGQIPVVRGRRQGVPKGWTRQSVCARAGNKGDSRNPGGRLHRLREWRCDMRKWLVMIIGLVLLALMAGAELQCNVDEDCAFLCFE